MFGRGRVKLTLPDGTGTDFSDNQLQNGHAEVLARLLGDQDQRYLQMAMYIEFENVASPGDAVTNPSYGKSEGVEYYSSLSGSSTRDFLRVQLSGRTKGLDTGMTGAAYNKITFTALTEGTAGVHGRPFSSASNSKICGAALVSAPDWNDRSKDLIFGRKYYDPPDQVVKPASGQITVTYTEAFEES